jgi:hypothetical protein
MNSEGYFRIMKAITNLIVVLMVEAGKVPTESAQKVGSNILKAITGKTEKKQ